MKLLNVIGICFFIFLANYSFAADGVEVTPSEVYAQVDRILKETRILQEHFKIKMTPELPKLRVNFKPRHVWQKAYEVLLKLNILRAKIGLPVIEVNSLEPLEYIAPVLAYEQTQRILTEVKILKFRLNITKKPGKIELFYGKTPSDVFHRLDYISTQLDLVSGIGFTPSYTFAQAMRIYDDVITILNTLEIKDSTDPPNKKKNVAPSEVFERCQMILQEIGRLQRQANIDRIDFSGLRTATITPTEVFAATEIILAELQTLKANLGLKHSITPPANYYEGKNPADVLQVLGWTQRKIELIRTF